MRVGMAHHWPRLGRGCHPRRTDGTVIKPAEDRADRTRHGNDRDPPAKNEGKPLDDDTTAGAGRDGASVGGAGDVRLRWTSSPPPCRTDRVDVVRAWPLDFPDDIAVQRRAPYEARADSVMYRRVLAGGPTQGWDVHLFDAKDIESQAASILGDRADEVLHGPPGDARAALAEDHRMTPRGDDSWPAASAEVLRQRDQTADDRNQFLRHPPLRRPSGTGRGAARAAPGCLVPPAPRWRPGPWVRGHPRQVRDQGCRHHEMLRNEVEEPAGGGVGANTSAQ